MRSERSTLTFSSRTASASNATGGSMAVRESSCSMWFCTMSRRMPAVSKYSPRPSTPMLSATVSSTCSTYFWFHTGSKMPFPNRKTRMFWTVSLPR